MGRSTGWSTPRRSSRRNDVPRTWTLEVWDRIVDIAYRGTYVACVEFGKRMARHGAGAIVNISSMVGQRPNHGHAYYSAKAAVNMLTEGMAGEWGRSGVRVNAVSPGFVAVPRMVANIADGRRYAISPVEMSALGRLVEPSEVAESIAFLLSDRASAITGANLVVDAGVLATNGWIVHGGVPPARERVEIHDRVRRRRGRIRARHRRRGRPAAAGRDLVRRGRARGRARSHDGR
jgi:NAD(P)-dependent dehydrogenase (short-subunit alcohol dehydrogenase family)